MPGLVFEVKESPSPLLDDPLAEMTRLIIAAVLDAVRLHAGDQTLAPDSFSFIGLDEARRHPICPGPQEPEGGEANG